MSFLTDRLDEVIKGRFLRELFFGIPAFEPPENAYYFEWGRLNIILEGSKTIMLPLKEGPAEVTFKAGQGFYALPASWETNSWKTAHKVLVVAPREHYMRYSYYQLDKKDEGMQKVLPLHVHHTGRPYGSALRNVIEAMNNMALGTTEAGKIDLTYALLNLAREEYCQKEAAKTGKASTTFIRISEWLENHLHEPIDRNLTAAAFGLNPSYLSQLFTKVIGKGFNRYLTEKRMNRAQKLLQATSLNIYQVAGRCGFSSSAHFIKRFREMFGITPVEFRQADETSFDRN